MKVRVLFLAKATHRVSLPVVIVKSLEHVALLKIHSNVGKSRGRVGVGMSIADHPLHRSQQALLMHWAPALGDDAKSTQGIGMMDSWRR